MILNIIFVIALLLPVSYTYGAQAHVNASQMMGAETFRHDKKAIEGLLELSTLSLFPSSPGLPSDQFPINFDNNGNDNILVEQPAKIVAIPVVEIVRTSRLKLLAKNKAIFVIENKLVSSFNPRDYAGQTGIELINNLKKDEIIGRAGKNISNGSPQHGHLLAQALNIHKASFGDRLTVGHIVALALATKENKIYAAMSEECKQASRHAGMKILIFFNPEFFAKLLKVELDALLAKVGTITEEEYNKCYYSFYRGDESILTNAKTSNSIKSANTRIKNFTIPEKKDEAEVTKVPVERKRKKLEIPLILEPFSPTTTITESPLKKQRNGDNENK